MVNCIQVFCRLFLNCITIALTQSIVFQHVCSPSKFSVVCLVDLVAFCSFIFLFFAYESPMRNNVQRLIKSGYVIPAAASQTAESATMS